MLISKELKNTNIAEYTLYMWQTEDLIRSFNFEIEKIQAEIIEKYPQSEEIKKEIKSWYSDIIQMMEIENIKEKGHLQIIKNTVSDMHNLHLQLLASPKEIKYQQLFQETLAHIYELESKMQGKTTNSTDACLHGLYGILLLKLNKQKITEETTSSMKLIARLMAYLSNEYVKDEH